MDDVDHHAVFDLVLRARDERLGDLRVALDVTGARCRTGERVRPHVGAVDLDQQLGDAPTNPSTA